MVTSKEFQEIHIGQVWSVRDHHHAGRRSVRVVGTTDHINDPTAAGDRLSAVNTETGRRTYMKASTLRKFWRLEREANTDEQ